MKTLRSREPSFSDNTVQLYCPRSWSELTQRQLRYVYSVLGMFDSIAAKVYIICRLSGLHVVKTTSHGWICFIRTGWFGRRHFLTIQSWQIQSLIKEVEFVDSYESMDVRLDSIHGYHAVDGLLHNVSFIDYLNIEKMYQLYLADNSKQNLLLGMARIMYRDRKGRAAKIKKLDIAESTGVFLWYSHIKSVYERSFPHFFKRLPPDKASSYDMLGAINAQIRALTDGDVTKEKTIFSVDCWRALTELDQKARENEEYQKKYGK